MIWYRYLAMSCNGKRIGYLLSWLVVSFQESCLNFVGFSFLIYKIMKIKFVLQGQNGIKLNKIKGVYLLLY